MVKCFFIYYNFSAMIFVFYGSYVFRKTVVILVVDFLIANINVMFQ